MKKYNSKIISEVNKYDKCLKELKKITKKYGYKWNKDFYTNFQVCSIKYKLIEKKDKVIEKIMNNFIKNIKKQRVQ